MNSNSEKIKKLVGLAIFVCLVVVLQVLSNYIQIGQVSITLALIPIVVGSIIYGPWTGFLLGAVCGLTIFFGPGTIAIFWPLGIVRTFFVCILKTGLAGLAAGYIYKIFKNKNVGVVLASISVPIINTGLFALAAYFLYYDLLADNAGATGQNIAAFLFLTFIGFNFIIEFVVNSLLSPVVLRLVNIFYQRRDDNKQEESNTEENITNDDLFN